MSSSFVQRMNHIGLRVSPFDCSSISLIVEFLVCTFNPIIIIENFLSWQGRMFRHEKKISKKKSERERECSLLILIKVHWSDPLLCLARSSSSSSLYIEYNSSSSAQYFPPHTRYVRFIQQNSRRLNFKFQSSVWCTSESGMRSWSVDITDKLIESSMIIYYIAQRTTNDHSNEMWGGEREREWDRKGRRREALITELVACRALLI